MSARVLALSVLLMLQGCSDSDDTATADSRSDHVWKDQVETIDKARSLEQDINDAFKRRAAEGEAQSR